MRNKIAFACLKAEDCTARGGRVTDDEMVRFILGYDGDDPATQEMRDVAFAQADAVLGLLRQGPTVTVTRDKHGYQYASLPGVVVDDLVAERSYALVLLPEEG